MTIIQLIFALLKLFVPMDPSQRASLEVKGTAWLVAIDANSEATHPLLAKLKKYQDEWYVQVLMAVLYIPLVKLITDFMAPNEDEEEDDNDNRR